MFLQEFVFPVSDESHILLKQSVPVNCWNMTSRASVRKVSFGINREAKFKKSSDFKLQDLTKSIIAKNANWGSPFSHASNNNTTWEHFTLCHQLPSPYSQQTEVWHLWRRGVLILALTSALRQEISLFVIERYWPRPRYMDLRSSISVMSRPY